jgi:hypothetical protein
MSAILIYTKLAAKLLSDLEELTRITPPNHSKLDLKRMELVLTSFVDVGLAAQAELRASLKSAQVTQQTELEGVN